MTNFSAERDDSLSVDSFSGGTCSTSSNGLGALSSSCILSVLSSLLERIVARNHRVPNSYTPSEKYRVFRCGRVPAISIESYLQRILKHTHVSPSVFVVAYVYIDRLCEFQPQFHIDSFNVHRLLITTVMLASKFLEDLKYGNSYYARVGGLVVGDINEMEREFLFMMKFKLQVSVSIFESYCSHLEREVAMGGGYQIERTLRMVCGRLSPNADDETSHRRMAVTI